MSGKGAPLRGMPFRGTMDGMKILAVTDETVERLYSLASSGHFADVELILSCGDLPYSYLEYLVTVLNVPLCYVPGNHDPVYNPRRNATRAEGCENVDGRVVRVRGLTVAGLGGSVRYHPQGVNQYSQSEMMRRAWSLMPALWWSRLRHGRGLDVLITHSPPLGIHDDETQAHRGLRAINWLIRWGRPRYHLHGHVHFFRRNLTPSITTLGATKIINVFPYQVIEI
jgi:Icc-related predicted phosphoesterase